MCVHRMQKGFSMQAIFTNRDEHAGSAPARAQRPSHASPLLTAEQAAKEVFGVSVRTFHTMREQGLLPDPLIIGQRNLRWVRAELEAAALSMPRKSREQTQHPESLRRSLQTRREAGKLAGAGA